MKSFFRTFLAAVLMAGALPQGGGRVSHPVMDEYMARLARESPLLYELFSRESDPAKNFCGLKAEVRPPEAALTAARLDALSAKSGLSSGFIAPARSGAEAVLFTRLFPTPGPDLGVLTPPPRPPLPNV